jgi:hypothetical protein
MTGVLTVVQGDYTVTMTLRQGRLVNSSSLGKPRRLGQLLVAHGLVERSVVEDALLQQSKTDPPQMLGHVLLERGVVTTDQLRQAIRLQLEEEMWDLFSLADGSFKFEHRKEDTLGEALVEMEVEPLIMEGTRRLDEWSYIVKNIPNDEVVPALCPPGDDGIDREALHVNENEWRVLSLVNGFYNVGSLAMRSGIGRFETFRVLNALLASGVVKLREDVAAAGPAPDVMEPVKASWPKARKTDAASNGEKPGDDVGTSSSTRLMALFRKKLSAPVGQVAEDAPIVEGTSPANVNLKLMHFQTVVGFLGGFAQNLMESLLVTPDFAVGPEDAHLLAFYWNGVVMSYPRADLVCLAGDKLDVSTFEKFIKREGNSAPFHVIYEETLEALTRLVRTIYLVAAQRLGTREGQRIVGDQLAEFRQRAVLATGEEFYYQDFLDRIISG